MKDNFAGVGGSADFGSAAVVEDDFGGRGVHDDASGGVGEAGDVDAGIGGEGSGEDVQGNVDSGRAVVMYGNGDQPAGVVTFAGGDEAGLNVEDGEVGQAAIAEDPVREEPAKVFATGLFEELFEADGLDAGVVGGEGLVAPFDEGLLKGFVAGDVAEHPPDSGGFAAVVKLVGGGDEGLANGGGGGVRCLLGVKADLGDVERLHQVIELEDGGGAALILLDPDEAHELGEAFVEPGLAGVDPGVGEGVGEGWAGGGGGQLVDGGYEQGVVLEGGSGVVEDGERG